MTTTTKTKAGRYTVRFVDPATGKAGRRTFRSERDARVFAQGIAQLRAYWAESVTASVCADYASGNVRTVVAS